MENSALTPNGNNNDAQKQSDSNGEQKPEELKVNQPKTKSKGETKPITMASPSEDRSTGLDDICALPFSPPLPSKGSLKDFVDKASADIGLPVSHAWAVWIFLNMAHCGHRIFYDDGCVERRIAPNVILAGDDESTLARRIAVEVLSQNEGIKVVTDPTLLQTKEELKDFSSDVRRVVVDTGDENLFLKWHKKVSKQEISLAQLFCPDSLNDYLSETNRAKSMPPASVPILLSCQLREILSDRKFPYTVFRDSLVIPSFGCQKQCSFTAEVMEKLLKLLSDSAVELPDDIFLTVTSPAQDELDACLKACSMRVVSLQQEGSDALYRRTNITFKVLCLAAAYAINEKGESFDGKITKEVMQLAIRAFDKLDEQWNAIGGLYEEASRADEVDIVYDMVLARFSNYYDERCGGLVVPFQELAKAYCHHPDREGQFTTGYLERKILSDIVLSGRAKQLPGRSRRDRKWVFYSKRRIG